MPAFIVHVCYPPTECQQRGCDKPATRVLAISGHHKIVELLALCPEHEAEYLLRLAQWEAAKQARLPN